MPHAVWLIMEQVAIAALDTSALDLAAELIKDIKAKFPESERSTRLAVSASPPPYHHGFCICIICWDTFSPAPREASALKVLQCNAHMAHCYR